MPLGDPIENPAWVLAKVARLRGELFASPDDQFIWAIFAEVAAMLAGRAHDFKPIDPGYTLILFT